MPLFLSFNNYIKFLIQSLFKDLKIFRNMQNKIETRGNLCTELGPPVDSLIEEANSLIYKHTILFC